MATTMQRIKRRQQEARFPMKSKIGFLGIFVFLVLAVAAKAGNLSGKWIVTVDNVDVEMNFKVNGSSLTGTVNNPLGGETKIKEGKIDGDNFSFIVTPRIAPNHMRFVWKGVLDGDVIRLTRVLPGGRTTQVVGLRPKKSGN
jgi:hypothetical protein